MALERHPSFSYVGGGAKLVTGIVARLVAGSLVYVRTIVQAPGFVKHEGGAPW